MRRETYDWGRRPLGFQSRSRDSSVKPVSAMVAAALADVLSLLAGWGGLAVGDEEAIPTDCLRRMVWFGMIDDGLSACSCKVVYAEFARD